LKLIAIETLSLVFGIDVVTVALEILI